MNTGKVDVLLGLQWGDEAARVLLENGAQTVYFLCICVGRGS